MQPNSLASFYGGNLINPTQTVAQRFALPGFTEAATKAGYNPSNYQINANNAAANTAILANLIAGRGGQSTAPANTSTTVPSTGNAGDIQGSSPINLPTPAPGFDLNSMVKSFDTGITTDTTDVTTKQGGYDTANNDLVNLLTQLTGESPERIAKEEAQGIPQLQADLTELNSQAKIRTAQYLKTYADIENKGGVRPVVSVEEARAKREAAADIAVINSNIQAKSGQLTLAEDTVDQAMKAKYDPLRASIDVKRQILDSKYKDLSEAKQKLADDKMNQLDLQLKIIDRQASQEKDFLTTVNQGLANGAPLSVVAQARNEFKAGNEDKARSMLSPYTGTKSNQAGGGTGGGGTTTFTKTQLNTGAANSGLPLADFGKLDYEIQNFYISKSTQAKAFNESLKKISGGSENAESTKTEITGDPTIPQPVKDYMIAKIDEVAPAPKASWWKRLTNWLGNIGS